MWLHPQIRLLGLQSKSNHYKAPTLHIIYQHQLEGAPTLDLLASIEGDTNPLIYQHQLDRDTNPLIYQHQLEDHKSLMKIIKLYKKTLNGLTLKKSF